MSAAEPMNVTQEDVDKLMDMFGPEDLHPELAEYLETGSSLLGSMIRHPLVFSVPHWEQSNKMVNRQFAQKTKAVAAAIAEGNWATFVFLHERPYRVDALEAVLFEHEIEDPAIVWPLISSVWIDSENIYQNFRRWKDIWEVPVPRRTVKIMDMEERAALNALPATITVYRGVAHESSVGGMSWTTDRDKAVWFARRFAADERRKPMLATATVRRKDVIAHFLGRNEFEIVVLPEDVTVLEVVGLK
jgi:hypothetical protein